MKKLLTALTILAVISTTAYAAMQDVEGKTNACNAAACAVFGWFCC